MSECQNILLVDDEPDIQTIAKMVLEHNGQFRVRTCSSGPEALRLLGTYKPDVILLDYMMPEMDGPHTLEKIKLLPGCQDTPVIFLTARVLQNALAAYLEMGAVDVITKPFDPTLLPQQVRAHLGAS